MNAHHSQVHRCLIAAVVVAWLTASLVHPDLPAEGAATSDFAQYLYANPITRWAVVVGNLIAVHAGLPVALGLAGLAGAIRRADRDGLEAVARQPKTLPPLANA